MANLLDQESAKRLRGGCTMLLWAFGFMGFGMIIGMGDHDAGLFWQLIGALIGFIAAYRIRSIATLLLQRMGWAPQSSLAEADAPEEIEQDHPYTPQSEPAIAESAPKETLTVHNIYAEEESVRKGEAPPPSSGEQKVQLPKGAKPSWTKEINWEEWIGQKLLQKLGILVVLIGMIVFLKYSFDNGWIGPNGRVALSMLGGCILMGFGEFFQKKYPKWFQGFTGGGLALLYLTIWAAHVYYPLRFPETLVVDITPVMANVLYSLVTLIGAIAAIRYKAQVIAWFAFAGGYVTPMLIEGASDAMGLILYLAILATGMLALAWHQKWRYINIAAFVCTQLYLYGKIYDLPVEYFTNMQQATVAIGFFLLFGILPFLYQFRIGTKTEADDILLTIGNGVAVFFAVVDAVGGMDSQYTSLVCLVLAAVYLGYAALALQKVTEDDNLINTYLVGSVILVALALYQEMTYEWVAAGWAPFSALLLLVSVRLQKTGPWRCAILLLAGSLIFLMFNMPGIKVMSSEALIQPFTSDWSLQSYVVFASLVAWVKLSPKLPRSLLPEEGRKSAFDVFQFLIASVLFGMFVINAFAIGAPAIDWTFDIIVAIALVAFAAVAIGAFLLTTSIVWFIAACIAQALAFLGIFVVGEASGMVYYGAENVAPFIHPWAGVSAAAFIITVGMTALALGRDDKRINTPLMHILLIGVVLAQVWVHISIEIHHLSNALEWTDAIFQRVLSGWWIVFALALAERGYQRDSSTVRKVGIMLLLIPLLKDISFLFAEKTDFYEVGVWTAVPALLIAQGMQKNMKDFLQYPIVLLSIFAIIDSFIFLTAIEGSSGLYHILWWSAIALGSAVGGARVVSRDLNYSGCFLLTLIAAMDLLLANQVNFYRSIWWAFIALLLMISGFTEKASLLRKLSIVLFGAVTAKILLFILSDSSIPTAVKIGACIGTGLLMIGASYMYQRFGEQLKK